MATKALKRAISKCEEVEEASKSTTKQGKAIKELVDATREWLRTRPVTAHNVGLQLTDPVELAVVRRFYADICRVIEGNAESSDGSIGKQDVKEIQQQAIGLLETLRKSHPRPDDTAQEMWVPRQYCSEDTLSEGEADQAENENGEDLLFSHKLHKEDELVKELQREKEIIEEKLRLSTVTLVRFKPIKIVASSNGLSIEPSISAIDAFAPHSTEDGEQDKRGVSMDNKLLTAQLKLIDERLDLAKKERDRTQESGAYDAREQEDLRNAMEILIDHAKELDLTQNDRLRFVQRELALRFNTK